MKGGGTLLFKVGGFVLFPEQVIKVRLVLCCRLKNMLQLNKILIL